MPLLKSERQGSTVSKEVIALSAPVADSFVRQSREGLSAGETVKSGLTSALILLAMTPFLRIIAKISLDSQNETAQANVKQALRDFQAEQQRNSVVKKPQATVLRSGEAGLGVLFTSLITWSKNNLAGALTAEAMTTLIKHPSEKGKEDAAAALEKVINARMVSFSRNH